MALKYRPSLTPLGLPEVYDTRKFRELNPLKSPPDDYFEAFVNLCKTNIWWAC